jgi:multiple antibiotic resistance protein
MSTVIFSVSFIVWGALLVAPKIAGYMGQTGINVVTRVMGLMLAAIAVEFIAKGLSALFPVLASVTA